MDEKTKTPEVIVEQTSEQADLSLFGLIVEADFFVQFIMFLLLLSSVWCWTIIINKSRLFRKEKRISKFFEEHYNSDKVDDDALLDHFNNSTQNETNAQNKCSAANVHVSEIHIELPLTFVCLAHSHVRAMIPFASSL